MIGIGKRFIHKFPSEIKFKLFDIH